MTIVLIEHADGSEGVYCWGVTQGVETVRACLKRGEEITVRTVEMTTKQYDALPEYDGECE